MHHHHIVPLRVTMRSFLPREKKHTSQANTQTTPHEPKKKKRQIYFMAVVRDPLPPPPAHPRAPAFLLLGSGRTPGTPVHTAPPPPPHIRTRSYGTPLRPTNSTDHVPRRRPGTESTRLLRLRACFKRAHQQTTNPPASSRLTLPRLASNTTHARPPARPPSGNACATMNTTTTYMYPNAALGS